MDLFRGIVSVYGYKGLIKLTAHFGDILSVRQNLV